MTIFSSFVNDKPLKQYESNISERSLYPNKPETCDLTRVSWFKVASV